MDVFVFLYMFHRLLLPMFSSFGICAGQAAKFPKASGAGSWQSPTHNGNYPTHKMWPLSAVGSSPSGLGWKSQCWQKQQGHVQGCLLGKTFLIKNVEKGLTLFMFWSLVVYEAFYKQQRLFYLSIPSRCALRRNGQLWNCGSCSLEMGVKGVLRNE